MNRTSTSVYWSLAAITLLCGIGSTAPAQTITHEPLYTFQVVGFGGSVSGVGDVNGDGMADLIVGASFSTSGGARVFSGSDGSVLYDFDGDGPGDRFGQSVSGAGDVNGDGIDDLIVGALNGSTRVFSGSDGSVLYTFNGNSSGNQFGHSVSGAGDVNGDGTPDLIVGASRDSNNGLTRNGSARVLSGSDGSVLYNFQGDVDRGEFGHSVSGAGDVNGDGMADLIVGAPFSTLIGLGPSGPGYARVFSGSDGSVLYNFQGDGPGAFFGTSVSGAGDVNGDGMADLIVGTSGVDNSSGSARVLSGSDGSLLYSFDGDSALDAFGGSVSSAGDVNGDGTPDLIVGAIGDDNNGVGSGSVRIFSGIDGNVLYNFNGNANDFSGDVFGVSVSCAGDVNGDGIDDFIVGAIGGRYARVFVSQISQSCLLGDVDMNGTVNFLDIAPFIAALSGGTFQCAADCDQSGIVSFRDIAPFIAILSRP